MKTKILFVLTLLCSIANAQYYSSSRQVVVSNIPSSVRIGRIEGNSHPGPHSGCLMCLGNHLITIHGQTYTYLNHISYNQWSVLHDNLHNSKNQIIVPQKINTQPIFAPTPMNKVYEMLDEVRPTQYDKLYDLGSGDGRIVVTAAKKYGCQAVGIEIDEKLYNQAKQNAHNNYVENMVKFVHGDIFKTDISKATIITLYLEENLNASLIPQLQELPKGVLIISYLHKIPNIKYKKIINNDIYLYITPIQFQFTESYL